MSVRFLIGRAGSGKTLHCYRAIVESLRADPMALDEPILWIVPKQATFMAERQLACGAGLPGVCRARVVSFELLGEEVLAECGGCAIPEVTASGRQMVLGHLLRRHQPELKFFGSVAKQAGLAAELDAAFAEFERRGRDPAELATLAREFESNAADDPHALSLVAKFHDLHLLYSAYSAYLGQDRLDPHRRLQQVLSCIERCRLVQNATVYVDGFLEFTDFERRTLAAVAKVCPRMDIALLLDPKSRILADPHLNPDELELFHQTEQTYKRLWFAFDEAGVDVLPPLKLEDRATPRFINAHLGHIERHLFDRSHRISPVQTCDGIELVEAPDRGAEVDAAARRIRAAVREEGLRLREIAVLVRDLETYHATIDASFREHDIGYFVDRRRAAAHHPLPQALRALVLLALHDWPEDAVLTLLKSGLCGLELDEADELENYVLLHRIRGSEWASSKPWAFRRSKTRRSAQDVDAPLSTGEAIALERINELRERAVKPLRTFVKNVNAAEALPVRQLVTELFKVLEAYGVRKMLHEWIDRADRENDLEQRGEHEQVWAETVKLFDQLVDLMGDEVVSLADFLTILDSGLEQFDLALTPPTQDQVLVGGVERTRTPPVKFVILLGLTEGEFPRAPRDRSILSDGERKSLAGRNVDIDPDGERRLLDENLLGYLAFTRASERLCMCRPCADDEGRQLNASIFWRRLRAMFPNTEPEQIARGAAAESIDHIGTPRQLVTGLMRWVRSGPPVNEASSNPWQALYHWLATHPPFDGRGGAIPGTVRREDPIDVMRFRSWKALAYANDAKLSPEIARDLFGSPLRGSVSRIETFASCSFRHFARYGLRLQEREEQDVTPLDLGNVYHEILEKFVNQLVDARKSWDGLSPAISAERIRTYAREVGQALRGELMLSTARNQYLLQWVQRSVEDVVARQGAAAKRGRFKPRWAELTFGGEGAKLPPFSIATPAGHTLELYGKIDRVDLLDDEAAVAVIDYKLRGDQLALDRVYHGIALQLLTYLLVLQANGQQLEGKPLTPAAAFYVRLLRTLESVKHPADSTAPNDPLFHLNVKPRGVFNSGYLTALDENAESGWSEVVHTFVKGDGDVGRRKQSDAAEPAELRALLAHVRRTLATLADQIIGGDIAVQPFRLNTETPCPRCEFRALCRFDVPTNRYHFLTPMDRQTVLARLNQQQAGGGSGA